MTNNHPDSDAAAPAGGFVIVVNGRPETVRDAHVTYEEVVALAFPTPPTGENVEIVVTYRNAQGPRPDGTLAPGGAVNVKRDGTIFNATPTDKS